jgi:FKBP-type peptidyl-prolyl cis-trans isomerase FkpA
MLKSRILAVLALAACFIVSCENDPAYDKETQAAIDDGIIRDSIKARGEVLTLGPKGLYYSISKAGEGTHVLDSTDQLSIHYVARLYTTGVLYDSTAGNQDTTATKFVLANVIEGWKLGIPLIKPKGRIRLIVPSTLAYQNRIVGTLPANTILDFDIQFIKIITQQYITDSLAKINQQ